MTIKSLLVGALALTTIASAAHAALITNGDFSLTDYKQNNQFGTGFGGQGVSGWTGNGGYSIYFFSSTASTVSAVSQYGGGKEMLASYVDTNPSKGGFVGLDGDSGARGGISQQISGLTVGTTYALTFDWAAGQVQSRTGPTTEQLSVTLGSETHSTGVLNVASGGFDAWRSATLTFTATAASELLSFLSIGTPDGLPPIALLDNVSLNAVPVAVPEPVSLSLLGVGLVGIGAVQRLRRRKA